jgi:hypothetical protein
MLQLAASINGRLALVSCGACETLVDFMLQNKVSSVHGCLFDFVGQSPLCMREKRSHNCNCDKVSCLFHRWYVCAALALEGCASGALRLNRAGWDRNWHAVVKRDKTVEDEVILKLKHRALMVPPIVLHCIGRYRSMWVGGYTPPGCFCCRKDERCPLEEPAFLEFLDTTPGDDRAADEASNVPSSRLE